MARGPVITNFARDVIVRCYALTGELPDSATYRGPKTHQTMFPEGIPEDLMAACKAARERFIGDGEGVYVETNWGQELR